MIFAISMILIMVSVIVILILYMFHLFVFIDFWAENFFYIQSNAHFLAASAFETIILQLMQRKPSKFIFSFFRVLQKMNEKMFSAIMIFDF